jgi:hypothetical protein
MGVHVTKDVVFIVVQYPFIKQCVWNRYVFYGLDR